MMLTKRINKWTLLIIQWIAVCAFLIAVGDIPVRNITVKTVIFLAAWPLLCSLMIWNLSRRLKRIRMLAEQDDIVKQLDSEIAALAGAGVSERSEILDLLERGLRYFHLLRPSSASDKLNLYHDHIIKLAAIQLPQRSLKTISPGTSLLYLCYVLSGIDNDDTKVRRFLKYIGIANELSGPIERSILEVQQSERNMVARNEG